MSRTRPRPRPLLSRAGGPLTRALAVFTLLGAAACSSDPDDLFGPEDAAPRDGGGRDAASERSETGSDAPRPPPDARVDRAPSGGGGGDGQDDASTTRDAPTNDAARETGVDAARETGVDAARDAAEPPGQPGSDAAPDRDADPLPEPPSDAAPDIVVPPPAEAAPPDASAGESDAAPEAAPPPPVDAAADVAPEPEPTPPPIEAAVPPRDAPVEPPPVTGDVRRLDIVAHPDDDLLFMNPDLDDAIQAGATSRTVYMTSGDQTDGDWNGRETRIKAAHAFMAGVASDWTCGTATFAAHDVVLCTLPAAPRISTIFLRLRDGLVARLWARANEPPFAVNPLSPQTTIDDAVTYTRDDAIDVLRAIMANFVPTSINTLDSSLAYGVNEHPDHAAAGMFALVAAQAHGHVDVFTIYRGYSTANEPANLSGAVLDRKMTVMRVYAAIEPGSDYDTWVRRRIAIPNQLGAAALRQGVRCIDVSDPGGAGSLLALGPCAASPAWSVGADAQVHGAGGLCLAIRQDGSRRVELAACADSPFQKWVWSANGQLRGADATCLAADEEDDGVSVDLCDRDSTGYDVAGTQRWAR